MSSTQRVNGTADRPVSRDANQADLQRHTHSRANNEPRNTRTSDPMAFSSILTALPADPPKPPSRAAPSSKQFRRTSALNGDTPSNSVTTRKSHQKPAPSSSDYPGLTRRPVKVEADPAAPVKATSSKSKAITMASDKENEKVRKEMAKIDAMELSEIETPKWTPAKVNHARSSQKRYLDVEDAESGRRKVSEPDPASFEW